MPALHFHDLRSHWIPWFNDLVFDKLCILQLLGIFDAHTVHHYTPIHIIVLIPFKRRLSLLTLGLSADKLIWRHTIIPRLKLMTLVLYGCDLFVHEVGVEADSGLIVAVVVVVVGGVFSVLGIVVLSPRLIVDVHMFYSAAVISGKLLLIW